MTAKHIMDTPSRRSPKYIAVHDDLRLSKALAVKYEKPEFELDKVARKHSETRPWHLRND